MSFPTPFATVPSVQAMARGGNYPDTFAVTIRAVTTTGFTAVIRRQDAAGGWGQALLLDWLAWDDEAALRLLGAAQIASGLATIGPQSNAALKQVPVPLSGTVPFTAAPILLLTPLGENVDEAFAATTAGASASGFTANVCRADGAAGWSQNLRLSWLAIR